MRGSGWTWAGYGARLLRGVEQDQPVIHGGVEHRGEQDVDLRDGVGRQRLAEAGLVLAPRGLQLAVVRGDAGGGELVDADRAKVGRDVVSQDLLVTLDGRVLQPQGGDPVVGVLADGRRLGLEPRLEPLLLERLVERALCFVETLETTSGQPGVAELGALGVLGDGRRPRRDGAPLSMFEVACTVARTPLHRELHCLTARTARRAA